MTRDEMSAQLLDFIREKLLDNDPNSDLNESTPLLEWGILNSMNTIILLNFIRDELEGSVSAASVNGQNFKDVNSITSMIIATSGTTVALD
ncbi:MAG: acyl carrier protein [Actinoallomurus sp.]